MIDTQAIRSKLLDLAIRGKLTEQRPEDGTAEELYRQIQAEKQALIQTGKIRKEKPLPENTEEEIPFEIPNNWKWVALGNITSKISSGNTPTGGRNSDVYVPSGFPFFREQNIYDDGIRQAGMVFISEKLLETRPNSTVKAKDILLNITGGSIGRCALVPDNFDRGSINQHILIIRTVKPETRFYLHMIIRSSYVQSYIKDKAVGDKDGFSGGRCKRILIPLPPLAEQHRIAERVGQAFSILDTIDTLQAQYTDNLTILKSKLIDSAIQGKLTEQLPEDGTAEDLYRQIQSGKIKKGKPHPLITEDEIPFEIPENWRWVRLGDISESVNVGIVIRPSRYYVPQGQGTPAFRNCNIQQGFIDDGEWVYLNADAAKENPRAVVKNGDILVARSGTPGNCCVVTEPYSGRGAVDIVIVRLRQKLAVPDFIKACLCSPFAQKTFLSMSRGVALSHLGATTVSSLAIPLPPLAEQKRIVAKLSELLPLCETR